MAGRAALKLQPVTRCAYSSPRRTPFRPNPTLYWIRRKADRCASCFSCSSLPEDRKSSKENPEETFQVLHQTEPGGYSLIRSASRLIHLFRVDSFDLEIMTIAVPAALALAADPLTSLVDTAFVGHFGSVELSAVGVSVSVFNLVSKLFNVPLLNITTSFVAEQEALDSKEESNIQLSMGMMSVKKNLPAVSTSLSLAAAIGVTEALALSLGSGLLLNIMGIPFDSPMRAPAEHFLTFRAYGAPPIVVALATQGIFRGFMDTKTPLYAIGIGNILNAALDLVLIVFLDLGIKGAAIATVISEYVIALILFWKLSEKVDFIPPNFTNVGFIRYLSSGTLLISRTIAILLTMTLATSMAAREGPIQMAGHQICLQVWLAVSLLNDALALAAQALLASEYTKGKYEQARMVVYRVLQIGLITGIVLALFLFVGFGTFIHVFTTDPAVMNTARSGIWFVTISQPVNAIAFVFDGLYYGVSDFAYAAYSMVFVGLLSSIFLLIASPIFGLSGVWTGLFLFMALRTVAGFWRLGSKGGPWKMVLSEKDSKLNQ